ncbi:MAG: hypothetical protein PHW95_01120 [Patescibacteria group bacterium]|nr:hypothetical protein [Patescibacteria group bacterium]
MTKFLSIGQAAKQKTPIRRNAKILKTKSKSKFFNFVMMTIIGVMFFGYLVQVNSLATKGYQIKALQGKVTDLKQQQDDLQLQALSLQSMGAVQDKVNSLKMVDAGKSDYLVEKPVAVAR